MAISTGTVWGWVPTTADKADDFPPRDNVGEGDGREAVVSGPVPQEAIVNNDGPMHGLKMSGMPAWGIGHDDETLWSIVAFVGKLSGMSAQQYKDLVAKALPDEEMESMDQGDGHTREHDSGHHEHNADPSKEAGPKPNHHH